MKFCNNFGASAHSSWCHSTELMRRITTNIIFTDEYDELENLQWKVEYLRNEVNMLEIEKWKSTNRILKLNRMIDEFEGSLAQKRGEIANMNQENGWYDNTNNLYPIRYSEPEISSYSIRSIIFDQLSC
jgi:hypothetical protein